jgi:hypothetical protein
MHKSGADALRQLGYGMSGGSKLKNRKSLWHKNIYRINNSMK